MKRFKLIGFVILCILASLAYSQNPVIHHYDVQIKIEKDAQVIVTEQIEVSTDGNTIKRGIFRFIPTRYKTADGLDYDMDVKLLEVKRDDAYEPYQLQSNNNELAVYVGSPDKVLTPGRHHYQLTYRVKRGLAFYKTRDELYWNVTGNGWNFPVLQASAHVLLPPSVQISKTTAFTGYFGAREKNYTVTRPAPNEAIFRTTQPLEPGQGISVISSWPKGKIAAPGFVDRTVQLLTDNPVLPFSMGIYFITLLFFTISWFYLGRTPLPGSIIPCYQPPEGLTPQALRYIKKMRYDMKMFTSALINMAVKKHLRIEEKSPYLFVLRKTGNDDSVLSRPEKVLSNNLFGKRQSISLLPRNQECLLKAVKAFRIALRKEFRGKYFILNTSLSVIGLILSGMGLLPLLYMHPNLINQAIKIVGICLVLNFLPSSLFDSIQDRQFPFSNIGIITLTVLMIVNFGIRLLTSTYLPWLLLGLFVVSNIVFFHAIKKPTMLGAKVMREAKGFEFYLRASEKDPMNFRNSSEKTPAEFEKFLPYATALGLENTWEREFEQVLIQSQYKPDWYLRSGNRHLTGYQFSHLLGQSMERAIVEACQAPGHVSHIGGSGGCSGGAGGGFGGGGGGGW